MVGHGAAGLAAALSAAEQVRARGLRIEITLLEKARESEAGGNTRTIVDAWFRRAGVAAKPIMELGSVEAIKVLVESGLGASILPKLALKRVARSTVVCPLRPALTRELAHVLRKDKVVDRGLRVLLGELAKTAGK